MAISFVAAGAVATGANPTVDVPAGYTKDDFLILTVTNGTTTPNTPSGWTQISAQGAGQYITTFYKFADSNEGSVTLSNSASTTTKAVITAYRGVGLFDVVSSYTTSATTTVATASQTTLLPNDYVISIYSNASGAARTWTAPASTTTRVNSATTTNVRGLLIVDEVKATAGATTTRTATIGGASNLSAVSISIREPQTLYWRGGGTQTWSTTNKAPWSLTSGGTGGVAAPNELDNVIFNTLSNTGTTAFTVTLSGAICNNFTIDPANPIDAAMTIAGGTSSLFIYGSINWSGDNGTLLWSGTPTITFGATVTGKTLHWGSTGPAGSVIFDGIGGGWTFLSNFTNFSATVTLTNGSLALSTFGIFCTTFASNNSNVRTMDFGTGYIGVYPSVSGTNIDFGTTTNLTVAGRATFQIGPSGVGITTTITSGAFPEANSPNLQLFTNNSTYVLNGSFNNIDWYTGNSGTPTVSNTPITIYGSLANFTGYATLAAGSNAWTFAATSGTKTISTGGTTLDFPITFNGVGGTWQLQNALTVGTTRTVTLTNGTLSLNNFNLTCGSFSSNNSNTRSIAFGTGQIYLTGTNVTVLAMGTVTNYTYTGTPVFNATNAGTAGQTRTISFGGTGGNETNAPNINVTAGTDTIDLSTGFYDNLNFTGFSGTLTNNIITVYGNYTISSGMTLTAGTNTTTFSATSGTQDITTNSKTLDFPVTFNGVGGTFRLIGSLTVGSTRTVTLTNGALNLNNNNFTCGFFSSNNSNTRSIAFGTGQFYLTGFNNVSLAMNVVTGYSYTGTPVFNLTYSGSTGTRNIIFGTTGGNETNSPTVNVTAGTDPITFGAGSFLDLNFTGYSGTISNAQLTIYGNLTISTGMSLTAGTGAWTFASTSGTDTITSNGKTFDFPVTFNGVGGTWQLIGSLTVGTTRTVTLTVGTLNLNNNNFTCGIFSSSGSGVRTVTSGTGQFYITGNANTVWTTGTPTNLTFTTVPTVNLTYVGSTGSRTINNASAGGDKSHAINLNVTAGTDVVTCGATTIFNNVNFTGYAGPATVAGIIYGDFVFSSGMTNTNANALVFPNWLPVTQNVTSNGITANNSVGLGYSVVTTGASGDGTTATITFATQGINFYPVGSTIEIVGVTPTGYNGTYTVTSSTLSSVSFLNATTGSQTVAGRVGTGTASTVKLQDALTLETTTIARTLTIGNGTLDLNNFNVTCYSVNGNFLHTRAIAFGTGQIFVTGNNTNVWNFNNATGYTLTGNPRVVSTYSGSVGTRTFSSGGAGGGTETNAVSIQVTGGSDILNIGNPFGARDLDLSGFTGTVSNLNKVIYGNLTLSPTLTWLGGTGFLYFQGSGIYGQQQITTASITIDNTVNFFTGGGSYKLLDNLTVGSTRQTFLTAGALDLNDKTLSTGLLSSSNSNLRSIAFGTGKIVITGSAGGVFNADTGTNLSYTGTGRIEYNYNGSTGTRTITGSTTATGTINNAFNHYILAGSDTLSVVSARRYGTIDFTGFSGVLSSFGTTAVSFYGDLTFSPTMTFATWSTGGFNSVGTSGIQKITSNGATTVAAPLVCNGTSTVQLQDAYTSLNYISLNLGTLDLNSKTTTITAFQSNFSTVRTLAFGSGPCDVYITGSNSTVWGVGTIPNMTITGATTATVYLNYNGSTGTRTVQTGGFTENSSPNFSITAGTDTFTTTAAFNVRNLNFTGFAGTYTSGVNTTIYGNYTLSTGMSITGTATYTTTFAATSGTKTITNNGKTIDFPVTFDGVGGTWQLQDAMTVASTRSTTLTNGTLDLYNNNLTTDYFNSNNTNTRSIAYGTGQIYITGNATTVLDMANLVGFSFTGTPIINLTYSGSTGTRTINLQNYGTYNDSQSLNVTAGTDTVAGSSSGIGVRNLNFTGFNGTFAPASQVALYGNATFSSGMTYNGSTFFYFFISGNATGRTITTNGISINQSIYFYMTDGSSYGDITLQDALTTTGGVFYTRGTVNLNNNNLTTTYVLSPSGSGNRTLNFGTGQIYVTNGASAVSYAVEFDNSSNNLQFSGSRQIILTYNGSSTRYLSINGTDSSSNRLNISVTAGTGIVSSDSYFYVNNLDFTGFTGTWQRDIGDYVYGNLTLTSGMTVTSPSNYTLNFATNSSNTTNYITTAGKTLNFPVTFNTANTYTHELQDALTLGSTKALTINGNGTIKLKANTVSTVGSFVTSGTTMKYLRSTTPGTRAFLSQASGTNYVSYLDVQDSYGTGGAVWDAINPSNVNSGNNLGWGFSSSNPFIFFY